MSVKRTLDKAVKCMDGNKYIDQAVKWLEQGKSKTEVIFGLQRMGLTPTDASSYLAKAMAETGYKYNK